MKEKNVKKIGIIVGVVLFVLCLIGVGYAFYQRLLATISVNTSTHGLDYYINYTKGQDVTGVLEPTSDYTDGSSAEVTFYKKDNTYDIYGHIYLDVSDVGTNLSNSNALRYTITSNDMILESGSLHGVSSSSSKLLIANIPLTTTLTKYKVYIWLDENVELSDIEDETITSSIRCYATMKPIDIAIETLTRLGLSVDTTHTPDFSTCSGNSCRYSGDNTTGHGDGTNGIYSAPDDLGTSYYFRGAVNNNYVSFAGKTWRIVRINGDGTIRIALNGSAGTSAFNSSTNDNAYVGYMYGTSGSSTYALTHTNTNNSTIKTFLDNWYDDNLSSYSSYIADSIFCNDRSLSNVSNYWGHAATNTGIGTAVTAYSGYKRTFVDYNPSLICPNNNDKFTVSSSIGNGALTKPIGLLTIDEYIMAGAGPYDASTSKYYRYTSSTGAFYLYDNSKWYWSMSPDGYAFSYTYAIEVRDDGSVGSSSVSDYSYAVRPAVSLKADAITGGTGTSSNPFTVG